MRKLSILTIVVLCLVLAVALVACNTDSKCENGHIYSEEVTKAATCTEAGSKTLTCTVCGETTTESIPALGHDLKEVAGSAVAAGCTEAGKAADKACSRCDHTVEGAAIAALGHDVEHHDAKSATCTEGGWDAYDTCKREGCDYSTKVETAALGHDMEQFGAKPATCTEIGWDAYESCKREGCDHSTYVELPALGHDVEHHNAKAATCTEGGWDAYDTCKRDGCEYSTKVELPALGHDEEQHAAQAPTCTEAGWDAYVTCKREGCDYSTYVELPATGHRNVSCTSYVAADCTHAGNVEYYACADCGKFFADEDCTLEVPENSWIIGKIAHNLDYVDAVAPDCTTTGNVEHWKCAMCGKLFADENGTTEVTLEEVTLPKAHVPDDVWHYMDDIQEPTCTDGVLKYHICTICGEECDETVVSEALGHDWQYTIVDADNHGKACSRCAENTTEAHADEDADGTCDLCGFIYPVESNGYTLVTDVNDLTVGDIIVLAYNGNAMGSITNKVGARVVVVVDGDTITDIADAIEITLGKDGEYWTLYDAAAGKYIAAIKSTKNKVDYVDTITDVARWTISADLLIEALDGNTNPARLQYNANGGQERYCVYNGGQKNPSIYKKSSGTICAHQVLSYVDANPATCTENGNVAYYTCAICGGTYADEACTQSIDNVVIDATGHTPAAEMQVVTEATWNQDGSKTLVCTACGEILDSESIPALGMQAVIDAIDADLYSTIVLNGNVITFTDNTDAAYLTPVDATTLKVTHDLAKYLEQLYLAGKASAVVVGDDTYTWNNELTISSKWAKGEETLLSVMVTVPMLVGGTEQGEYVLVSNDIVVDGTALTVNVLVKKTSMCTLLGHSTDDQITPASWNKAGETKTICSFCGEVTDTQVIPALGMQAVVDAITATKYGTIAVDGNNVSFTDATDGTYLNPVDATTLKVTHDLAKYLEQLYVKGKAVSIVDGAKIYTWNDELTISSKWADGNDTLLGAMMNAAMLAAATEQGEYLVVTKSLLVDDTQVVVTVLFKKASVCAFAGHTETSVVTPATCTDAGYTTYTCTRCGAVRTADEVAALGHDYADTWSSDAEGHWYACSRCDSKGSYAGHSFDHDVCTVCGTRDANACAHANAQMVAIVNPTCTTAGTAPHMACPDCGMVADLNGEPTTLEALAIAALGHDHQIVSTLDATCTEPAKNVYECSRCEDTYTADVEGSEPTGHDWGKVYYTWSSDRSECTAKRTCKTDADHIETETVMASSVVVEPKNGCESAEYSKFTAIFTNPAFAMQEKPRVKTQDADEHTIDCAHVVAKDGESFWTNLKNAIDDAAAGSTVTMLRDYDILGNTITIDKKITLDLNGFKLYSSEDVYFPMFAEDYAVITVAAGGNLTIKNGTVEAKENDVYAIHVLGGGNLTIVDGTYIGNISAVYVQEGKATIKGGHFSLKVLGSTNDARYTLNCYDANYLNGTAKMVVSGGSYDGFNPSLNLAEGEGTNFCNSINCAEEADGVYTVVSGHHADCGHDLVARNGDVYYRTLAEAINNAAAGDTIDLVANAVSGLNVMVKKDIVLNLNGYTITTSEPIFDEMFGPFALIHVKAGTLTINGNGNVTALENDAYCVYVNGGAVVLNGGSYKGNTTAVYVSAGTATINEGSFELYGENATYMLNCLDAAYDAETANIVVNGGVFKGFNPANNSAESAGDTDFTGENAVVVEAAGVYTVSICAHANVTTTPAVAATCTVAGSTERQVCNDCGKVLLESVEVPATNHEGTTIVRAWDKENHKSYCTACSTWLGDLEGHTATDGSCVCGYSATLGLKKVMSTSELYDGMKVYILDKNGTKVMTTTQNSNNRAATAVSDINNMPADAELVTLVYVAESGNWYLQVSAGYLYVDENQNRLKTTSTGHEWIVTIADGEMVAKDVHYNSRTMRLNDSLFACYTSGQTAVAFYTQLTCNHNLAEVSAVSATCTEDGNNAHYKCLICDALFADAEGTTAATDVVIAATGHNMEHKEAIVPTCTEGGQSEFWACDRCGKYFSDAAGNAEVALGSWVIAPTGHNMGYVNMGVVGHVHSCANGCGLSINEEHTFVEGTCVCGAIEGCAHLHTSDVVTLAATCTESGTKNVVCDDCNEVVQNNVVIPALGHKNDIVDQVLPTCTQDGYSYTGCSRCGAKYDLHEWEDALGHDWEHGTYNHDDTHHWKVCGREGCTAEDTENKVAHNFSDGDCVCGMEAPAAGPVLAATFTLGNDGSAGTHIDGSNNDTYSEDNNGYSFAINGTKVRAGGTDAQGNGILVLGTGSAAGSFSFTVAENVTKVKIYIAKYKTNSTSITVNGGSTIVLTKNSNDGEYDEVEIDTSSVKTISVVVSSGKRAVVNTVEYYA